MDGDQLRAVGKSCFDLDVVNHFRNSLHHLVACEYLSSRLHEVGDT